MAQASLLAIRLNTVVGGAGGSIIRRQLRQRQRRTKFSPAFRPNDAAPDQHPGSTKTISMLQFLGELVFSSGRGQKIILLCSRVFQPGALPPNRLQAFPGSQAQDH
ncbi:MAG TPA: hypothetical protein VIQ05_27125 [Tardiphaga sp.]